MGVIFVILYASFFVQRIPVFKGTSNCDLALIIAACRTLEMTVAVLYCNLVLQ